MVLEKIELENTKGPTENSLLVCFPMYHSNYSSPFKDTSEKLQFRSVIEIIKYVLASYKSDGTSSFGSSEGSATIFGGKLLQYVHA